MRTHPRTATCLLDLAEFENARATVGIILCVSVRVWEKAKKASRAREYLIFEVREWRRNRSCAGDCGFCNASRKLSMRLHHSRADCVSFDRFER